MQAINRQTDKHAHVDPHWLGSLVIKAYSHRLLLLYIIMAMADRGQPQAGNIAGTC